MNMKYVMYILRSERTNKFYIGSTGNLEDRIIRHNNGRSKATKTGIPWKLVYSEDFLTRSEAQKREMELKSWKSHTRIEAFIQSKK